MSTRSMIGVWNPNHSVTAIYCHWDGYPDHVGYNLENFYTSEERIQDLIDLGHLSHIGPDIGVKHDFHNSDYTQCTAYGRDRDEADTMAIVFSGISEFVNSSIENNAEYLYLWDGKAWYVYDVYNLPMWDDLREVLNDTKL